MLRFGFGIRRKTWRRIQCITRQSTGLSACCALRQPVTFHVRVQMRTWEIVAATLVGLLVISAPARATLPGLLVVIESVTSRSDKPGQVAASFSPSMIVRVIKRDGSTVLVQRLDDDERIGWVKRQSLAELGSFKPMDTWRGQTRVVVYSESGDSQRTYQLHLNGTYRSVHEGSSISSRKEAGLLLRQGKAVWARPARAPNGEPDTWAFFWLLPGGKLCHLTDAGGCASE